MTVAELVNVFIGNLVAGFLRPTSLALVHGEMGRPKRDVHRLTRLRESASKPLQCITVLSKSAWWSNFPTSNKHYLMNRNVSGGGGGNWLGRQQNLHNNVKFRGLSTFTFDLNIFSCLLTHC